MLIHNPLLELKYQFLVSKCFMASTDLMTRMYALAKLIFDTDKFILQSKTSHQITLMRSKRFFIKGIKT